MDFKPEQLSGERRKVFAVAHESERWLNSIGKPAPNEELIT